MTPRFDPIFVNLTWNENGNDDSNNNKNNDDKETGK